MQHVNVTPIIMAVIVQVSNTLSLFDKEISSEILIFYDQSIVIHLQRAKAKVLVHHMEHVNVIPIIMAVTVQVSDNLSLFDERYQLKFLSSMIRVL